MPDHGISYGWLVLMLLVRDALLLSIAALVVREMWCPWLDVVRVDGADDPGGGVFDEAPDGWLRGEAGRLVSVDVLAGEPPGPDEPGADVDSAQSEERR